jgi:hypothetical protein
MQPKFALLWRRDGPEGIEWFLRGILPDGSFYGSIHHYSRRKAAGVDGLLPAADWAQCREILGRFEVRPPFPPGPCFALLARWFETLSFPEILFKYEPGDEATSEDARAFLQLKILLEKEVSKAYVHLV